jgi:uncharacterized protein YndB with AHSA1/START domain
METDIDMMKSLHLCAVNSSAFQFKGIGTIRDMAPPTFEVDNSNHALSISVDLATDMDTAWGLWSDPRILEKWWGPPEHPCVISIFEFRPGGEVRYVMTGPDGTRYSGWWQVLEVSAPTNLRIRDGFGESPEDPAPEMPVATSLISFSPNFDSVRMTITSYYDSTEDLQRALDLNMEEGFMSALSQIEFLERA